MRRCCRLRRPFLDRAFSSFHDFYYYVGMQALMDCRARQSAGNETIPAKRIDPSFFRSHNSPFQYAPDPDFSVHGEVSACALPGTFLDRLNGAAFPNAQEVMNFQAKQSDMRFLEKGRLRRLCLAGDALGIRANVLRSLLAFAVKVSWALAMALMIIPSK